MLDSNLQFELISDEAEPELINPKRIDIEHHSSEIDATKSTLIIDQAIADAGFVLETENEIRVLKDQIIECHFRAEQAKKNIYSLMKEELVENKKLKDKIEYVKKGSTSDRRDSLGPIVSLELEKQVHFHGVSLGATAFSGFQPKMRRLKFQTRDQVKDSFTIAKAVSLEQGDEKKIEKEAKAKAVVRKLTLDDSKSIYFYARLQIAFLKLVMHKKQEMWLCDHRISNKSFRTVGMVQIKRIYGFQLSPDAPVLLRKDKIIYTNSDKKKRKNKIIMHKLERCAGSSGLISCEMTSKYFSGIISYFQNVSIQTILIGKNDGEVEIRSARDLKIIAKFRPAASKVTGLIYCTNIDNQKYLQWCNTKKKDQFGTPEQVKELSKISEASSENSAYDSQSSEDEILPEKDVLMDLNHKGQYAYCATIHSQWMSFSSRMHQTLMVQCKHGAIEVVDLETPPIRVLANPSISMLSNGLLAVSKSDTTIWFLNTTPVRKTGQGPLPQSPTHTLQTLSSLIKKPEHIRFIQFENKLIVVSENHVHIWEMGKNPEIKPKFIAVSCELPFKLVTAVIAGDKQKLVCGTEKNGILAFDLVNLNLNQPIDTPTEGQVKQLETSSDKRLILVRNQRGFYLLDAATFSILYSQNGLYSNLKISGDAILLKDQYVGWDEVISLKNSDMIKQTEQIQIPYFHKDCYVVKDVICCNQSTKAIQLIYSKLNSRAGSCTAVDMISGLQVQLFSNHQYDFDLRMTNVILRDKHLYYVVYNQTDKQLKELVIQSTQDQSKKKRIRCLQQIVQGRVTLMISPKEKFAFAVSKNFGGLHIIRFNLVESDQHPEEVFMKHSVNVLNHATVMNDLEHIQFQKGNEWFFSPIDKDEKTVRRIGEGKWCQVSPDSTISVTMSIDNKKFVFKKLPADKNDENLQSSCMAKVGRLKASSRSFQTTAYIESTNFKTDVSSQYFLTNNMIAIEMLTDKMYAIFRIKETNGNFGVDKICEFDATVFDFVFHSQGGDPQNNHYPARILDKEAKTLYHVNLESLIHLGAHTLRLSQEDMKMHSVNSETLHVLGQPEIPALLPARFCQFVNSTDAQAKLMSRALLKYTFIKMIPNSTEIKCENLLHYLAVKDNPQRLPQEAFNSSVNYIQCPDSPLAVSNYRFARTLLKLFKAFKTDQVCLGFNENDFDVIFRMPEELCKQYFDLMITEINHKWGETVRLQDYPYARLSYYRGVLDENENERIKENIIKVREDSSIMKAKNWLCQKTTDDRQPVFFTVLSEDVRLDVGTTKSIAMMCKISQLEGADLLKPHQIFESKTIQKMLDYKMTQVKYIGYNLLLVNLMFDLSICLTQDKWIMLIWLQVFIAQELIRVRCASKVGYLGSEINFHHFMDILKLTLLCIFLIQDFFFDQNIKEHLPSNFSMLMLISWLSTISDMRVNQKLRIFIDMLTVVIQDMQQFAIVISFVFIAVANAFYFDDLIIHDGAQIDGETVTYLEYIRLIYGMVLFADFSHAPDKFNARQWFFFFFATCFVFLIMMNLLIALVGDTYARVNQNKIQSQYHQLCLLIRDLEKYMFWRWSGQRSHLDRNGRFLTWGERITDFGYEEEQARVEGTGQFEGEIEQVRKELTEIKQQLGVIPSLEKKMQTLADSMSQITINLEQAVYFLENVKYDATTTPHKADCKSPLCKSPHY